MTMRVLDLMRDHGGNIDWAMRQHGGHREDWIDLSTGINRRPYPVPGIDPACCTSLPLDVDLAALLAVAREAYSTRADIVALAGVQTAIQLLPGLFAKGRARILAPTYSEHAAVLRRSGWSVEEVGDLDALAGADLAVVVNPNNPDGRRHEPQRLVRLADRVGHLVVDESFCDGEPALSLAPSAGRPGLIVLRSLGKFYGLAGVRLGFALASPEDAARLAELGGPWPVSGPAIAIGKRALGDRPWALQTAVRLAADAARLDRLAQAAGWRVVGGTRLFRLCETGDARAAQVRLAQARIWSRVFPWSPTWLRLGLPGVSAEWDRLARAIGAGA
jgi:cobalamin biosynthesis protein CobC